MKKTLIALAVATSTALPIAPATADHLIYDDLIVTGSECLGFDCADGENFGYDTLRLKENNLQIHFDDTSSSTGFPANDWRIIANDSVSGGASYLAIEDSTAGNFPFKIAAGAGADALFIDNQGDVGLGTAVPALDLQITKGDTPGIRLEQNGSAGWAPQTWDIAANETNFFVRDTTNGSKLPLRIRPGAPSNSLFIAPNGDLGLGTAVPTSPLHLQQTTAVGYKNMVMIENNGGIGISLKNTNAAANDAWVMGTDNANNIGLSRLSTGLAQSEFKIKADGTVIMGPAGASKFNLAPSGNLTIAGTLTQNSNVHTKENIDAVDSARLVATLAALPVSTWNYRFDDDSVRHVGPMAQDFYTAFGLGPSEEQIAPLDVASVAIVGVQELSRRVEDLKGQLAARDDRINRLEARLAEIEVNQVRVQESFAPPAELRNTGLNGL